jgi:hypothetical protein
MKGAPLAQLALLASFCRRRAVKARNCYWNIASNMERGAPIRIAFTALCVMRAPGGLPTPIASPNGQDEAQDDSV